MDITNCPTPSTFHGFGELPTQIRLQIWSISCPQIIDVHSGVYGMVSEEDEQASKHKLFRSTSRRTTLLSAKCFHVYATQPFIFHQPGIPIFFPCTKQFSSTNGKWPSLKTVYDFKVDYEYITAGTVEKFARRSITIGTLLAHSTLPSETCVGFVSGCLLYGASN
jgi:hypothetical protein